MSAVKDLAAEISERIAESQGLDASDVMDALMNDRVEIGAVGPSGRVWVSARGDDDQSAVLSFVTGGGFGLVASLDGGSWVTVRELQLPDEDD
ncbi:hypothetical protein [Microbacterium sp. VKM Ac-2923]|uniref:hypothetical protein n=1 Tax=Microbacterium sp. VKM Ac-2923 TaxID=2929476 RepID=UPI001FB43613|nr:hypothetical protein [Microbacterium sp. VKM Ac-2923]MCJ1709249.1 hypothetical protein [Microbacterium sp. VKM Ac-2923]